MTGKRGVMTVQPTTTDSNTSAHAERSPVPWAVALMAVAVVAGSTALGLFCVAIGLELESEGWGDQRGQLSRGDTILLGIAMALTTVAIVCFWSGLFRLAHPSVEPPLDAQVSPTREIH